MTDCTVCGRTLASTETGYSSNCEKLVAGTTRISGVVCADCILKTTFGRNER